MKRLIGQLLLIVGILCFSTIEGIGQDGTYFNKANRSIGFHYAHGNQRLLNVNYSYEVDLYQLQYLFGLKEYSAFDLDVLIQPQYNLTRFKPINDVASKREAYELGINAGVLLRTRSIKDFIKAYASISSGPHYVSAVPEIQSKGLNFTSNFFLGISLKLYNRIFLDLKAGFRHLSNANIMQPNRGINTIIIGGGLAYIID